jgi:hypothetical protein
MSRHMLPLVRGSDRQTCAASKEQAAGHHEFPRRLDPQLSGLKSWDSIILLHRTHLRVTPYWVKGSQGRYGFVMGSSEKLGRLHKHGIYYIILSGSYNYRDLRLASLGFWVRTLTGLTFDHHEFQQNFPRQRTTPWRHRQPSPLNCIPKIHDVVSPLPQNSLIFLL